MENSKKNNLKIKLFLFLIFIMLIFSSLIKTPKTKKALLDKFYDFINLSVIGLGNGKGEKEESDVNIDKIENKNNQNTIGKPKTQKEYFFELNSNNVSSEDILLINTMDVDYNAKDKVAPRSIWEIFHCIEY